MTTKLTLETVKPQEKKVWKSPHVWGHITSEILIPVTGNLGKLN